MSTRATSWLAWSLAALSVTLFLASIPLYVLAQSAQVPSSWGVNLTLVSLLGEVLFLAFAIVGALIASRRPRNPIGWILLTDGLLWMLSNLFDYYSINGVARPGSVPFPIVVAGINNWLWVPAVGLLGTYLLLLFPDGKLPSRRWRPLAWLSGVVILLLSVGVALAPGSLDTIEGVPNPFRLEGAHWLTAGAYTLLPLLPLCMVASALSLLLRYRGSVGVMREQIKWIAFAASVVVIVYLIAMVGSFIRPSQAWTTGGSVAWLNLLTYAALFSFTGIPVAVGLAVLRYRLYEIDLLINRTLVYGSLTATLVAVYLGAGVLLQYVFRTLTGGESQIAIVASTLAIAALFVPLRRRIQSLIDRSFYRRGYDAAKTLEHSRPSSERRRTWRH